MTIASPCRPRPAACLAVALLLPLCSAAANAAEAFVDTFDTFDPVRWYVSDGWSNGDHQNCEWSNREVRVRDGQVHLRFTSRPMPLRRHACAEIQSRARYGYGTYEARLRTPAGSGLNAAFFTYTGKPGNGPHDEVDFEFLLKDPRLLQFNTHVDGKGGNERVVELDQPADRGFRTYAFVWRPESIRFFVDGREMHRVDDPTKVPSRPSKIFFSLWGTDTLTAWMGPFEASMRPRALVVDRVSFTPLGEACPPGASVCAKRP